MTSATAAPADPSANLRTPTTTERTAMTTPDITAAIANARDVYECHPVAGQALDYLQAVLQADVDAALVDATKIASVAPTADCADQRTAMLQLAAEVANSRSSVERAHAEQTRLRDQNHKLTCELAEKNADIRELEQQVLVLFKPADDGGTSLAAHTAGDTSFGPVVGGSSWTIGGPATTTHFDQAAAKMAAESAQSLADAERMATRAGHVGVTDPLQTRIDAAVGPGLLDDLKAFVEEVGAVAAWAKPAPAQTVDLVLTIDISAIDAALAKVEQLKEALASVLR